MGMNGTNISDYLKKALAVLLTNISYLYALLILGMGICAPMLLSKNSAPGIFLFSFIAFIIIYPLIYGRYIEIISGVEHVSWLDIYQKHWVNFMVVQILMILFFVPVLMLVKLAGFPVMAGLSVISILVNIIGIYTFPLVFLTRERVPSILLGLKCLSGNFQFTIPLIILILVPTIAASFFPQGTDPLSSLVAFAFYSVNIVIDFLIFISASLILKEKLGF